MKWLTGSPDRLGRPTSRPARPPEPADPQFTSWRSAVLLAVTSARTYGVNFRVYRAGEYWWVQLGAKRYDRSRWKVDCLPAVTDDGRVTYRSGARYQGRILGVHTAGTVDEAIRGAFAEALVLLASERL